MPDPIKPQELCIVVRNTLNNPCTERDIGKPVTTSERVGLLNLGARGGPVGLMAFWTMKGGPWVCGHCGGLRDGYLEADLEAAILRELEAFILELGRGFAFVERQKRMVIDGDDHYLDLLFYHRRLRRLVAIELKLGAFEAGHKGQMELYLAWLNRHERQSGEEAPIGLILCAEASAEKVELLQTERDGITVAEYWTELPAKADLEQRLHQALHDARERLARRDVLLGSGE